MTDKPSEDTLFEALYWSQYRQGSATFRHASVGEPYLWATEGKTERAQHSVRRIDALVIRRSVAKGDSLWAVEIKISASDLRNELKNPVKTETWAQYTHSFYFLVTPELRQLALEIIPKQYGVMVNTRRMVVETARRAKRNPSPVALPLDTWRRVGGKLGELQMEKIRADRELARRHRTK